MRVLVLLFFAIFALAGELKIASFNTENLFDAVENGSEYKDFKNGRWSKFEYEKKLKSTSNLIKQIDADIIALQEIENENVLKDLAKISGYEYYKFATLDVKSPFGLGFLSKIAIKDSQKFIVKDIKTRPILSIDVEFDGKIMKLFCVHFPAKKNGIKKQKTAADTLKSAIFQQKNTVVLGDFNSEFGYKFLLKDFSTFKNAWDLVAKFDRKSHVSGRAIDHIIYSPDLVVKSGSFKTKKSSSSDHLSLEAIIMQK
ncbi:putative endonuclease/exonuclease/phosphatase [Campylobacter iguaniorum]|uniref:endonuclease/exonuclease/phosphatase family protein n=1 Tax=Campylobacter iguaniorum TaxID=1244531 RepID=UPI00073A12B3|nr:endonuclease/exonuclease/phosphatase family protein [Campylobacter iguaniorum]ALV24715.1 putative endonuclease/exonuclease/phosphatase [Campylobacter iguaniorum]